ncbi:heat shock protein Hsp20 [Fontimonas thermophila]|uniref:Heat shock protein Hsp20 n=1 Tax=Fontimonas thermophila TaxID=1076937 RepID=A0A1I2J225_9GAMM|nr:Hsp20/alpha crystallin family protein [Fontimonas thermophila]SFF48499.1 heat shock protein Hsp20 [Fontimonas thermophila]
MSITRYEPWALHRELLNEVNRLFGANDASSAATADWVPPVDIEEYADKFVLYADVPGIEPSSIDVTLEKGVLTLAGTREQPVEHSGIERKRSERASGKFLRRFVLPDTVDSDNVTASGKNGVLQVIIPKRPQAQPRKIAVTN